MAPIYAPLRSVCRNFLFILVVHFSFLHNALSCFYQIFGGWKIQEQWRNFDDVEFLCSSFANFLCLPFSAYFVEKSSWQHPKKFNLVFSSQLSRE